MKVDVPVTIYHYVIIEISYGLILQFVLIKWYMYHGVYGNQWINTDCFAMCTVHGVTSVEKTNSLFIVSEIQFWLYGIVGFKKILWKLKRVLRQPHNALTLQVTNNISPEVSVTNLFANLRVFLVGLGNSSEFLGFSIEVSEDIWRKIEYVLWYTRTCQNLHGENPKSSKISRNKIS